MRTGYGIYFTYPDTNLMNHTVVTVPLSDNQTVFNDRPPAIPTLTFADFYQGKPIATANTAGLACPVGRCHAVLRYTVGRFRASSIFATSTPNNGISRCSESWDRESR